MWIVKYTQHITYIVNTPKGASKEPWNELNAQREKKKKTNSYSFSVFSFIPFSHHYNVFSSLLVTFRIRIGTYIRSSFPLSLCFGVSPFTYFLLLFNINDFPLVRVGDAIVINFRSQEGQNKKFLNFSIYFLQSFSIYTVYTAKKQRPLCQFYLAGRGNFQWSSHATPAPHINTINRNRQLTVPLRFGLCARLIYGEKYLRKRIRKKRENRVASLDGRKALL